MKKILLIGTGGTIASKKSSAGLCPQISSSELLSFVPGVKEIADVDVIDLINLDSTNMQPSHWLKMASCIETHFHQYDGFVICHGTDTMAYTAAALSYLIQNSLKPVVITGAQKPIDLDDTDARTNLSDSIRFAACDRAYGVNIVFDGKVIVGTRARKERTHSYNAFSSINFPYPAVIQDSRIVFYIDDKKDVSGPVLFSHSLNTSVGLLKLIPSADADVLDFMAGHYDAVIIESFGVGGLPAYEDNGFKSVLSRRTKAGKIFVMTTQVPLEGSHMSVYEVGRSIKKDYGMIEAYDMTLEATVTKLMWILAKTRVPSEVNDLFHRTVNKDTLF
jgi:L-asparaginase